MTDVFILHADEETEFARDYLAVELGRDRVRLSSELDPGLPIAVAIATAISGARVTVALVSASFLHDRWARYGEDVASAHAAGNGLLVPLLLDDSAVPLRLDFRVKLDCRSVGKRDAEVARLRQLLALPAPAEREIPCPYPGMRPYAAEDTALFGGRDGEIDDLVKRIAGGCRELYVIGPSGAGKSSLVLSGVAPRLTRAGDAVVGSAFEIHSMRPGHQPAERLAALAAAPADGARRVLVVDQLEEIFSLADAAQRTAFFALLEKVRKTAAWHLVFTLRADFFGELMQSALWPSVERSHRHLVATLHGNALEAAIKRPAAKVGVTLQHALLTRLRNDAAAEPGSLPLVQETLRHLWPLRMRNLIEEARYIELGQGAASGLAVAASLHAEIAFRQLDHVRGAIARRVFLRLVSFGDGRAHVRRQQPRSALATGHDDALFRDTLHRLIEARLLTASGELGGDPMIDLAHEVLIATWPRLQRWIEGHRDRESRRRALEAQAASWIGNGRGTQGLLDRDELAEVDRWLTPEVALDVGVSENARLFIQASRDRVNRDRWLRVIALVALVGLMIAAVVAAAIAWRQTGKANASAKEARAQRDRADASAKDATEQRDRAENAAAIATAEFLAIEGEARLMDDPDGALQRLGVAARRAPQSSIITGASLRALLQARSLVEHVRLPGEASAVALSPDRQWIALGSKHRGIQVIGPDLTAADVAAKGVGPAADSVSFSPDSRRVAASAFDDHVLVIGRRSGAGWQVDPPRTVPKLDAVRFAPDGRLLARLGDRLVVLDEEGKVVEELWRPRKLLKDWDPATELRRLVVGEQGTVAMVLSDGSLLVWRPGAWKVVPLKRPETRPDREFVVMAVAISDLAGQVAVGLDDQLVLVGTVSFEPTIVPQPATLRNAWITAATFTPQGGLVTSHYLNDESTIVRWNVGQMCPQRAEDSSTAYRAACATGWITRIAGGAAGLTADDGHVLAISAREGAEETWDAWKLDLGQTDETIPAPTPTPSPAPPVAPRHDTESLLASCNDDWLSADGRLLLALCGEPPQRLQAWDLTGDNPLDLALDVTVFPDEDVAVSDGVTLTFGYVTVDLRPSTWPAQICGKLAPGTAARTACDQPPTPPPVRR